MRNKTIAAIVVLMLFLCSCTQSITRLQPEQSNIDIGQDQDEPEERLGEPPVENLESSIVQEPDEALELEETEAPIIDIASMTEDEYKGACTELWHDDIFFSDNDLTGKLVKLNLFVEEGKFFKLESIYDQNTKDFIEEYHLQRDLFVCGVKRGEDKPGYVGGQLYLYFPEECGYSVADFKEGDHLVFYGEIIQYSTSTWDGYNSCGIIPGYIVNNGQ